MMETLHKQLLTPGKLGNFELPNKVIMAPMTRSRASEGDVPNALMAEYYGQRSSAGLIISEASQISPQGKGNPRTPGIYSENQVAGWKAITNRVHEQGGRIFLQLWHVGRLSHSSMQEGGILPVAPSAIAAEGEIFTTTGLQPYETPRELETGEINAIVEDFRQAASNAREAGFDGVELHAANGYLVDQFLRDSTNHRTDAYGGSVENRCRFLGEVVDALVSVFGSGATGVRLSPVFSMVPMTDSNPAETFGHAVDILREKGVAYLHVIQLGPDAFDYVVLKERFGGTYIANGGYTAETADAAISVGEADFVSFGSSYVANPDLVERFGKDAELSSFDPQYFYQGEDRGYTDYPPLPAD